MYINIVYNIITNFTVLIIFIITYYCCAILYCYNVTVYYRNQASNHDENAAGFTSQPRQPYSGRRGRLWAGAQGAPHSPAELSKLRSALLKRTRGLQEPCVVPEKLLQRIDVGGEGALAISFSHSGHILASMYYIVLEYITVL